MSLEKIHPLGVDLHQMIDILYTKKYSELLLYLNSLFWLQVICEIFNIHYKFDL